jgi:hypothetical protein
MWCKSFLALMIATPSIALVRFHCSQLVIERLDPLVTPGMAPSPHVHQIVGSYSLGTDVVLPPLIQTTTGGNSFNTTMEPERDMPGESTCTSCQFADDFSNVRVGDYKVTAEILHTAYYCNSTGPPSFTSGRRTALTNVFLSLATINSVLQMVVPHFITCKTRSTTQLRNRKSQLFRPYVTRLLPSAAHLTSTIKNFISFHADSYA